MRVLVACEFSGVVRDAFIARGHDAVSCDLLPTERPGPHIQGDVLDVLEAVSLGCDSYDLMIAHPPCTYLANSGVRWLYGKHGGTEQRDETRWKAMGEGAQFFVALLYAPIARVAVENPVMHRYAREIVGSGPTQTIQPWEYGHPDSKRTGLWLRGLPLLQPTNVLPRPERGHWENQTSSGQNKLGPSADRWAKRSATYPGIADAMAEQWGGED